MQHSVRFGRSEIFPWWPKTISWPGALVLLPHNINSPRALWLGIPIHVWPNGGRFQNGNMKFQDAIYQNTSGHLWWIWGMNGIRWPALAPLHNVHMITMIILRLWLSWSWSSLNYQGWVRAELSWCKHRQFPGSPSKTPGTSWYKVGILPTSLFYCSPSSTREGCWMHLGHRPAQDKLDLKEESWSANMVGNRKAYMEGNMVTPVGNMLVNSINRAIVEMRKRKMGRL